MDAREVSWRLRLTQPQLGRGRLRQWPRVWARDRLRLALRRVSRLGRRARGPLWSIGGSLAWGL